MITNESLFDSFRGARRHGARSGWTAARHSAVSVPRTAVFSVPTGECAPDTAERLTAADLQDDSAMATCPECGHADYAAMFIERPDQDGHALCGDCTIDLLCDADETMKAIAREEFAMR